MRSELAETGGSRMTDPYAHRRRDALLARDFRDLGERMRMLRRTLGASLEELAALVGISASKLRRIEQGQRPHPKLSEAELLDLHYGGQGWVRLSIIQLHGARWSPWAESWPDVSHQCNWPAELCSDVWLHVAPEQEGVSAEHSFLLTWGEWSRRHTTVLDACGEYLVTGKGKDHDGISKLLNISCVDRRFYIMFGAGPPPPGDVPVRYLHEGWTKESPPQ
jgi:DNA-binding XRE family transcriptional regulator